MPKCTINGVELEVAEGTSIIEAMTQNEQRIAHYCWHPGLSVAGVCRLCMVEIEGNPRLQIACNTLVTEGMKITNQSEKVKEAVKWGLDFHLINHPLDCPICDQAGECGLQEQYMEYGKYDPEMAEGKVKKRKVVDLGPTVVLDSERCILCSRCTRFTDEVSKTHELGLFNRGDRTEIGTFEDRPLDNKYSLNTVDICPVGALTSKDFRFRQRVWYLKDAETICNGCSTGCNVRMYFNKEGLFRVKPVYNPDVNGHWMCDEGRDAYKFVNLPVRLTQGRKRKESGWEEFAPGAMAKEAAEKLAAYNKSEVALVLTGQFTNEEYEGLLNPYAAKFDIQKVYHWINNKESFDDFDGLLIRGDKNPNTKGLIQAFEKHQISSDWSNLEKALASGEVKGLIVAAPENQVVYPDLSEKITLFGKAQTLIWLSAGQTEKVSELEGEVYQIPLKSFVEKAGTFVNYAGKAQTFKRVTTVVPQALNLDEAVTLLCGENLSLRTSAVTFVEEDREVRRVMLEKRTKNEFVFKRGAL